MWRHCWRKQWALLRYRWGAAAAAVYEGYYGVAAPVNERSGAQTLFDEVARVSRLMKKALGQEEADGQVDEAPDGDDEASETQSLLRGSPAPIQRLNSEGSTASTGAIARSPLPSTGDDATQVSSGPSDRCHILSLSLGRPRACALCSCLCDLLKP